MEISRAVAGGFADRGSALAVLILGYGLAKFAQRLQRPNIRDEFVITKGQTTFQPARKMQGQRGIRLQAGRKGQMGVARPLGIIQV